MAAFGCADGPGTAYVVGFGSDGVVPALAEGEADGVDGGQVQDVEAHGGDLGDACFDVAEGAVLHSVCRRRFGDVGGGTGEEFVPAGEACALAVDPERELGCVFCGEAEVGMFRYERDELGGDGGVVERKIPVGEFAELGCGEFEFPGVGALGAGGGCVEMVGADAEGEGDVLRGVVLGGEALGEIVVPGVEVVDPGFDGEVPRADFVGGEGGGPEVVGEGGEGGGLPLALGVVAIEEACGDVIVAVAEDGGGDLDGVAEDALGGMAAVVDRWLDLFDDDSLAAFDWLHACGGSFDFDARRL